MNASICPKCGNEAVTVVGYIDSDGNVLGDGRDEYECLTCDITWPTEWNSDFKQDLTKVAHGN